MELIQQIKSFVPFNEQEQQDQQFCLQCLATQANCLTRENTELHFCASAMVVDPTRTKTLMNYHNIYQSWSWCGGHADGESDLLAVALREVREETGIEKINPLSPDIFAIDVLPVKEHLKKGKRIKSHLHLTLTYLLEADDQQPLHVKADENSNVAWIPLEKMVAITNEKHMKPVYQKLVEKLNQIKE